MGLHFDPVVAFVGGACPGIGRAGTERLGAEGACVPAADIPDSAGAALPSMQVIQAPAAAARAVEGGHD
jgi:NAD(P)-dependent dehydrogenase (short-subunit alcohol dehydrogenase family)